jgi:hypothetical protein
VYGPRYLYEEPAHGGDPPIDRGPVEFLDLLGKRLHRMPPVPAETLCLPDPLIIGVILGILPARHSGCGRFPGTLGSAS